MKPLLIGMNNPYGTDPSHALYPAPRNSAGHRLYDMVREGLGITRARYLESFDRVNLVYGEWDRRAARISASELLPDLAGRQVALLGREVQIAFGWIGRSPLEEWSEIVALVPRLHATFHAVPHPSGVNQWYNAPGNRQRVVDLLRRLYIESGGDMMHETEPHMMVG